MLKGNTKCKALLIINLNNNIMYYEHTTKEDITKKLKEVLTVLKDEQFNVVRLEDEDSNIVLFQIILIDKHINLNDLLTLGLAAFNPSIYANNNKTLITWHIEKPIQQK